MERAEDEPEIIQSLNSLLFPYFQPGCDSPTFLA